MLFADHYDEDHWQLIFCQHDLKHKRENNSLASMLLVEFFVFNCCFVINDNTHIISCLLFYLYFGNIIILYVKYSNIIIVTKTFIRT